MAELNEVELLLVEDNPTDIELTLRSLKKHNIANNLHIVRDGEEALDFLFSKGQYSNRVFDKVPKIILLDLKLPKVDGMEVLRRIRNDEKTRSIPVVIMTSSSEEKDIIESYRLGVNSYIVKPVDFDKFAETVAKLGYYWLLMNKYPA